MQQQAPVMPLTAGTLLSSTAELKFLGVSSFTGPPTNVQSMVG